MAQRTAVERFFAFLPANVQLDECWEWQGGKLKKYGAFFNNKRTYYAHRWIWEWITGTEPIETLDHVCNNPPCVNPLHLREMSRSENSARGRFQTHCKRGHEFTVANSHVRADGRRQCKACATIRRRIK